MKVPLPSVVTDPIGPLREALASRYEFQREIGQGAYATVYRALDLRHDRLVAIKVLNVDPSSDLAEVRFVREIKWLARLQHPNILPLHDSGHVGNLLYFITPYLSGESLRDKIHRERRLAPRDAIRIAHEIADALQYAHGCGVIHRDIKPDNILLSGTHAIVADFGVARAIDTARASQITRTGPGSPGTPAYMSPEQLLAGKNVDQRSDVYSLGCVLFEMLTGKPPFQGKEGFVRRFTDPPPSVRELRPELSPRIDGVIAKMLATDPANRYPTALEVARVLEEETSADAPQSDVSLEPEEAPTEAPAPVPGTEAPSVTTVPVAWRDNRWLLPALATVVIALVISVFVVARARRGATLDDNLLAVAPFSLFGADTIWREGLTDVLVRNLDGAGPLRTVASASSLQHWSGYSDRTSAENLGRAVRARLVVYGSVMRAGEDSVRVTADVMDVKEGRSLPALQWQDASSHIDRLTDSVTLGILRQVGEKLGVQSLSHLSLASTTTLAALKEFLQGEQYFRRTAWDSAFASYRRATELDSNFTLALWRAGVVDSWRGFAAEADDYKLRAGARNRGLRPRDSILVAADYLFAEADSTDDELRTSQLVQRLHETLTEAVRRYGDDPEVWYARGDALFHFQSTPQVADTRGLLVIFQRAIALDSTFAPPYIHAIELAFGLNDPPLAHRLIGAYLALQPTDFSAAAVRIASTILENGIGSDAARQAMATAPRHGLIVSYDIVGHWPDSAEAAVAIARELVAATTANGSDEERADARLRLARGLSMRGHLREALKTLTRSDIDARTGQRLVGEIARLGAIPPDSVRAIAARWRSTDPIAVRFLLPWFAQQRDSASIQRLAQDAAAIAAESRDNPARHTNAEYAIASARAYFALVAADTAAALRHFDALPDSLCQFCYLDRWTRLELLRSAGRMRDVSRESSEVMTRYRGPIFALFALEQARAAAALRDIAGARGAYALVAGLWGRADPELQPFVREAGGAPVSR